VDSNDLVLKLKHPWAPMPATLGPRASRWPRRCPQRPACAFALARFRL